MRTKSKPTRCLLFIRCTLFAVLLTGISGCGDFFEKKPTEIETRQILNDLEQVRESRFIANPLPEIYKGEPKKIVMPDGTKVFYFTKNHSAESLKGMISEQFGYKTTANSATNQVIVHCPDDNSATKLIEFLDIIDVLPIQVNIDCIVLERFADVTMDWETTILIENFLGEGVTFGADKYPNPAFPGASLRESRRSTFGLDLGYWINEGVPGHQFRAAVDLLISRGYLKILMNPTLETVNGRKATIISKEYAPIEIIVTAKDVEPYSLTEYKWVEDSLTVTPHVYSDGSIGLETEIKLGSKSKPEGVVQQSIITERSINILENRIEPGDSLVIGGIRKSEKRSVIRGIPFFKDIPVIGILFSSKDYEEKGTEIIFILTPSISSGGTDHATAMEDIREKHKTPKYKPDWEQILTDPFTSGIYTGHIEQKAAEAEYNRIIAEIEKAEADKEVGLLKEELVRAAQAVKQEQEQAEKARIKAQNALKKVQQATKKLKAEQQKAKKALQEAAEQAKKAAEAKEAVKAEIKETSEDKNKQ